MVNLHVKYADLLFKGTIRSGFIYYGGTRHHAWKCGEKGWHYFKWIPMSSWVGAEIAPPKGWSFKQQRVVITDKSTDKSTDYIKIKLMI